jgi:hypothetical protein
MPYFRFIVEGSNFAMPSLDDEDDDPRIGFFTTRRVKAADQRAAERIVLDLVADAWRTYAPTLAIVDAWKARWFELLRVPNAGHVFFSDEYGRYAAASVEAEASRAPKACAIWEIASLVEDDDE